MATPINTPLTSEIWHLSIDDLLQPLPESPRLGGSGPFVINLSASTAPISQPVKTLSECPSAHVYQIQRTEDRRLRYRLRMGPFATEDDAEAILTKVRDIYPSALTATAEMDDLRAIGTLQAKLEAQQKLAAAKSNKTPPRSPTFAASIPVLRSTPAQAEPSVPSVAPRAAVPVAPAPRAPVAPPPRAAGPHVPSPPVAERLAVASPVSAPAAPASPAAVEAVAAVAWVPPTLTAAPEPAAKAPMAEVVPMPKAPPKSGPPAITHPASISITHAASIPVLSDFVAEEVRRPAARIEPVAVVDVPAKAAPVIAFDITPPAPSAAVSAPILTVPSVTPARTVAPVVASVPVLETMVAPVAPPTPTPTAAKPTPYTAPPPAAPAPLAATVPAPVPTLPVAATPVVVPAAVPTVTASAPLSAAPVSKPPAPAVKAARPAAKKFSGAPRRFQEIAPPAPVSASAKAGLALKAAAAAAKGTPAATQKTPPAPIKAVPSKPAHVAPPPVAAPSAVRQLVEALDEPLPNLESTQTLRPLTPLELQDDSPASRWFVIQLSLSEEGFDPDSLPNLDIFSEYRLYSVAGIDQGKLMHALRVGFFTDEGAAGMVASYLGAYYEKPTIKRISVAERERFADQRVEARKDIGATGRHAVIEITDERVVRQKRTTVTPLPHRPLVTPPPPRKGK